MIYVRLTVRVPALHMYLLVIDTKNWNGYSDDMASQDQTIKNQTNNYYDFEIQTNAKSPCTEKETDTQ